LHLRDKGAAPLDVRLGVADVQPPLDAVEERRRDGEIAVGCVAVGDAPDMAVDPKISCTTIRPPRGLPLGSAR